SLFELTPPFVSFEDFNINPLKNSDYAGNPRLGFLYQYLCTELITESGLYSVVLDEAQINHDNGQTLGAIDLVLKNHESGQLEHWEVAIKFYLLHQGTWFGPNAYDQLDKKLARMLTHQLKMSSSAPFKNQYPNLDNLTEHLLL
ncbi:type II citrate synthase, partial [Vibrio xuii]